MVKQSTVAAAIVGLCHFMYPDGVAFGVGTAAELIQLQTEGVAPADAIAQPMTLEEAMELLA